MTTIWRKYRWLQQVALGAALTLSPIGNAQGDGGAVQMERTGGPFRVTLFSDPGTLRAGSVDFSVFLEGLDTKQPVLDGAILLTLLPMDPTATAPAWMPPTCLNARARSPATVPLILGAGGNRLLYSNTVNLPSAGKWQLQLKLQDGDDSATVTGFIEVQPPIPPWTGYWHLFAIPPLGILVFVFRRRILRQ